MGLLAMLLLLHIRNCDWNCLKAVSGCGYGAAAPAPATAVTVALPADHMNYSQNPNEIVSQCVCVWARRK